MTDSAYYDEQVAGALRSGVADVVADWPGVAATETFGCPSFTADGTLFVVVATQGVTFTLLPEGDRADLESAFPTESFAPGSRRVDSWVVVPREDALDDLAGLIPFLHASYDAARGEK